MPLPFIVGTIAAVAGTIDVGKGIHGALKMKEANDTVKSAQRRNKENFDRLENSNKKTMQTMDALGKYEMEIISNFGRFSDAFEKIKNATNFNEIKKDNMRLSVFTLKKLKDASVGANVLLGGATLGTAGGFVAMGGTTFAVMALGTAIFALSGTTATKATLVDLGDGSLAVGGGGVALGSAILGGATLGVELLIGGMIFSIAGSSVSDKADKAWDQMIENEKKINSICDYLGRLKNIAESFHSALSKVNYAYMNHLIILEAIIEEQKNKAFFLKRWFSKKINYNDFSFEQKQLTKNTILLVGLLYKMCKVQLVYKAKNSSDLNEINEVDVVDQIQLSEGILSKIDI